MLPPPGGQANAGVSYVLFGSPTLGRSGVIQLSSLNGTQGFAIYGVANGGNSGSSVSGAGDINGDGIEDLVIGANLFPDWPVIVGVSYVLFGSPTLGRSGVIQLSSLDGTQGFVILGTTTQSSNRWSVSAAGDINGDGIGDLVIGAAGASPSGPLYQAGISYVIFGSPTLGRSGSIALSSLNGTQGFAIPGIAVWDNSGSSVSGAGDINGDGIEDLVIGAPGASPGGRTQAGISYVLFGSPTIGRAGIIELSNLNGTQGFAIHGIAPWDNSGWSVSAAGDINGDGIEDLVIGAVSASPDGKTNAGASYVLFGDASIGRSGIFVLSELNGSNGFIITGIALSNSAGSISGSTDINGDGKPDLLIGAPKSFLPEPGSAYAVFSVVPPTLLQNQLSLYQGQTVQLNSENFNATDFNVAYPRLGFIISKIEHGAFRVNNASGTFFVSSFTQEQIINKQVQFIHDGSLYAPSYQVQASNGNPYANTLAQPAQIRFQPVTQFPASLDLANLTGINGFSLYGVSSNDKAGTAVSAIGDINGDGIDDFAIGAPTASPPNRFSAGITYVIFGRPAGNPESLLLDSLNDNNGFMIYGAIAGDESGTSVSGAGDINGDGVSDLVIGAPSASPGGQTRAGISYVLFGSPTLGHSGPVELSSLNGTQGVAIYGVAARDVSGWSVSVAGDINGDGIGDLVIGVPGASPGGQLFAGTSYVLFGSPALGHSGPIELSSLNGTQGFAIYGVTAEDKSGSSVSGAGDINGDGIEDLVIGAPNANLGGISYVLFGSPTLGRSGPIMLSNLNGTLGFAIYGAAAGYSSGSSVSGAGDINGDGISDLVVGASYTSSFEQIQVDTSYVLFGSPTLGRSGPIMLSNLNSTLGFAIYGVTAGDESGSSVSGAGDINGDGISDLVIGAPGNSPPVGQCQPGASYVLFGSPTLGHSGAIALSNLNNTQGFVIHGVDVSGCSGYSVSGGGDINGDGKPDLLIGAPYANSGKGASYVIYSVVPPELIANRLSLYQGQTVRLNSSHVDATSNNALPDNIVFSIANSGPGNFQLVNASGTFNVNSFTKQQLLNQQIQFAHDKGSALPPQYTVQASISPYAYTLPQSPQLAFHACPVLTQNSVVIIQGQALPLSEQNLNATALASGVEELVFSVSNVAYAHFQSQGKMVSQFTQTQIREQAIQLVADGSLNQPTYQVSVSDGVCANVLGPQQAVITFLPAQSGGQNASNSPADNTVRNALIGGAISGALGFGLFGLRLWIGRKTNQYLDAKTKEGSPDLLEFRKYVLRPIADEIFSRVKVTGFLGYINEQTMKNFIDAVMRILDELQALDIDLDFKNLSAFKKERLIKEVARQTRAILVPHRNACSPSWWGGFFHAEVTPKQIEEKASKIAQAVKIALALKEVVESETPKAQTEIEMPLLSSTL